MPEWRWTQDSRRPSIRSGLYFSHFPTTFLETSATDAAMPNPVTAPLLRRFGRLRFPTLFVITAVLFVINVLVPDPIPFIDELLLGLGTLLLGSLRKRREPIDIEPAKARDAAGR
jgi:hypothetical protein